MSMIGHARRKFMTRCSVGRTQKLLLRRGISGFQLLYIPKLYFFIASKSWVE